MKIKSLQPMADGLGVVLDNPVSESGYVRILDDKEWDQIHKSHETAIDALEYAKGLLSEHNHDVLNEAIKQLSKLSV